MSVDVLERLRAADPARDVDPAAPDALLRELRARPREAPRRRSRGRLLLLVPVVAAAAAVAILVSSTQTDLAARAYAQTAAAGDEVLYVHTTTTNAWRAPNLDKEIHGVSERWQQGDRWRTVVDFGGRHYVERRGADGVLRVSGGVRPDAQADPRGYIERHAAGFVAQFRSEYERGKLDERGTATFAGRAARRYVVAGEHTRTEYFVDAETGMPLGSIERFDLVAPDSSGTFTATTVVDALQHLAPTKAALAALNG